MGRIENSPPPESIQWSEHTTLADCVDDGTAEDDAHFQVPHGMIRLGSCQAGSAEGLVKLPTPGKWMIEFYVGIPQYKTPVDARPGEMGPDFFPVEDDAQTEPSDQVDVEIAGPNWDLSKGGVKTTFGNVQTSNEIPQKRLVMTFVEGDSFKFRFKFRSKQDVVNAHMFVNDGFATYVDDLVRGSHLSAGKTLEAGKGSVTGYVMNAVNGKPLLKSHRTSDGYTQDGLQLPNSNPTFELLVGSAEMKDVEVKDSGKFDVTVKAGEWTCRVSERGFMDFWDDACDVTAGETRYLPIPLSPLLNPGHARFVLTWGHEPQDPHGWDRVDNKKPERQTDHPHRKDILESRNKDVKHTYLLCTHHAHGLQQPHPQEPQHHPVRRPSARDAPDSVARRQPRRRGTPRAIAGHTGPSVLRWRVVCAAYK